MVQHLKCINTGSDNTMPALSEYSHIDSYSKANKSLGDSRSKVIGNNTKLVRKGGDIAVELHGNEIIRFLENKRVAVLRDGGYRSNTTKDRLNRYTPSDFSVFQRDYEWYAKRGDEKRPFENGMRVKT